VSGCDDPKQAMAVIHAAVDQLLTQNHIYKLANHGWVGPDDVDPEAVGHAIWQLEDPADPVLARAWFETEPLILPEWKTLCSVAGADFEGLMNGARLSIGHALFQTERIGESLDDEDSLGAVHSRAALMSLGAASERIRDYFVTGIFRMRPARYVSQNNEKLSQKKRKEYATPFAEAMPLCNDIAAAHERLPQLQEMAVRVQEFRDHRNAIVHQVSTELGRMRQRVIESAAQGSASSAEWEKLTDADFFHMAEQSRTMERAKKEESIGAPMNWYRLLIEFSEGVFFVENRYRTAHP
jgi:hypothetical protein